VSDPPFWRRNARFFGPNPAADMNDELRFHLETKTEDLISQGWDPQAARKEAERQFGDLRTVRRIGQQMGSNAGALRITGLIYCRTCVIPSALSAAIRGSQPSLF